MHNESYLNGWHAHLMDKNQNQNPYNEQTQAISYRRWLYGWCARFNALKRGNSLELDDLYE